MIEPQDAYTVLRRPLLPPKPEPGTYRAKLIARFGRVPTYQELAAIEAGKPWLRHGSAYQCQEANERRATEAIRERERQAAQILAMVTEAPTSSADIAIRMGIKQRRIVSVLAVMRERDEVKLIRDGVARLWTRKHEQGAA